MIVLEGVSKDFVMKGRVVQALKNVNMCIDDGDFVVIVGKSGSGKSTLLHILGGLLSADSGKYLVDGVDVFSYSAKQLAMFRANTIGFVFQQFYLVPYLSVYENIKLPLVYGKHLEYESQIMSYLQVLQLDLWKQHLPHQLSGGQKQRVCIIRALMNRPKLLLCDEPTGALDHQSAKQIMQLLKILNRSGMTIVLVTHDLRYKSLGNRLFRVDNGMVCECKI